MFISQQLSTPSTTTTTSLGPRQKTLVIDNIHRAIRVDDILHELVAVSPSLRPQRASLSTFAYTQRLQIEFTTSLQASHALSYIQRQQQLMPRGWNITVESLFLLDDDNEQVIDINSVLRRPTGAPITAMGSGSVSRLSSSVIITSSQRLQCPRTAAMSTSPIPGNLEMMMMDNNNSTSNSSRSTSPSLSLSSVSGSGSGSLSSANRVDGHAPLTRSPLPSQRTWSHIASMSPPGHAHHAHHAHTHTHAHSQSMTKMPMTSLPISPANSSFTVDSSSISNESQQRRYSNNNNHTRRDSSSSASLQAQQQKLFARDPHKGPRSTDWMLSEDTLRLRREKDEKFAQMVSMGLAKGRTKAGWAQARRPGKRDREAAKRRLAELQEQGLIQGEESNGLDTLVQGVQKMAVSA